MHFDVALLNLLKETKDQEGECTRVWRLLSDSDLKSFLSSNFRERFVYAIQFEINQFALG